MNFRELITEEKLEEGFFGDIVSTVKVASALKKYAEKLKDGKAIKDLSDDEKLVEFKKYFLGGVDIIEKSNLSSDMKESMKSGYLGGVSKKISALTGKKPSEWNEKLQFEQKIFKYMS